MDKINPFLFESSALPDDARVIAFRGREALNAPYEYEVWVATAHGDEVDLEDALFAPATLTVDRDDGTAGGRGAQHVSGVIAGVDHVHEHGGRAIFSVLVVPRLWLLGQSEHSRVFVDQSFDAILKSIVDTVGISGSDLEMQLAGLPVEEHVCQYRESDLAFLHRWLEREGLTYYFDHEGDAEKLVVTDAQPSVPVVGGPVRYHARLGGEAADFMAQGHFQRLRTKRIAMPRSVKLSDYDYAKPQLAVKGDDAVLDRGQAEIVRFGDRFFDPDRGAALAKLRGQALRGKQEIQVAEGNVLGIRPGSVVEIEQHPRSILNQKYLVLAAEHTGVDPSADRDMRELVGIDHEDHHRVRADLLATTVEHKPLRTTAWPSIHAHQLAVVDGPADSEYAQIDDQGRYKVKFLFDEGDGEAGKASTWVRMMQPHGGNPEGIHFPLRKGTEVVVSFLDGDPDRPIIAGAVPNAETPSQVTQSNHTRNVIRTGANNFIEMDDTKSQEWIHASTPNKNTHIHMGEPRQYEGADAHLAECTDGSGYKYIGGDRFLHVKGSSREWVEGDVSESYDQKKDETVTGNVAEEYYGDHGTYVKGHRTYTVVSGQTDTIKAGWSQTVEGGWEQTIKGGWKQTIEGPWIQGVDDVVQSVDSSLTQTVGGSVNLVHGSQNLTVSGAANWTIGGGVTLFTPSATMVGASWKQVDASHHTDFKNKTSVGNFELAFVALKIGINAVNIAPCPILNLGITPMKIDICGFKLANKGISLANAGPDIKNNQLSVFT